MCFWRNRPKAVKEAWGLSMGVESSDFRLPWGWRVILCWCRSQQMGLGHTREQGRRFKLLQCDGLSCHSKSKECVIPECWLLRRVAHVWWNMKAPDLLSLAREKKIHGSHCQGRPKQALPSWAETHILALSGRFQLCCLNHKNILELSVLTASCPGPTSSGKVLTWVALPSAALPALLIHRHQAPRTLSNPSCS